MQTIHKADNLIICGIKDPVALVVKDKELAIVNWPNFIILHNYILHTYDSLTVSWSGERKRSSLAVTIFLAHLRYRCSYLALMSDVKLLNLQHTLRFILKDKIITADISKDCILHPTCFGNQAKKEKIENLISDSSPFFSLPVSMLLKHKS